MEFQVYRPSRIRNGKRVVSRMYSGRLRLQGELKVHQFAQGTSDKKVAIAKLEKIQAELEQVRAGLKAPKAQRDAQIRPLGAFLPEYAEQRLNKGRAELYVKGDEGRLKALFAACQWQTLRDVTLHSFEKWRCAQKLSPKTLNEYLNAAVLFFKWMRKMGFAEKNPLAEVERVDIRGRETKEFRAYTLEEFGNLVKLSGKRGIIYLPAGYSGLRRGELSKLEWCNFLDDGERARIKPHALTTKNRRSQSIPVMPDLREALLAHRPVDAKPSDLVFPDGMPDMRTFRKDLAAAGIPGQDEEGRIANFHSLRRTTCTLLAMSGASQAEIMAVMRHTDPKLSMDVYMDSKQMANASVVENMPSIHGDDARRDARGGLKFGQIPDLSGPGAEEVLAALGPEYLWPASSDPEEFMKAWRYFVPPLNEEWIEDEESAPSRNRTCIGGSGNHCSIR